MSISNLLKRTRRIYLAQVTPSNSLGVPKKYVCARVFYTTGIHTETWFLGSTFFFLCIGKEVGGGSCSSVGYRRACNSLPGRTKRWPLVCPSPSHSSLHFRSSTVLQSTAGSLTRTPSQEVSFWPFDSVSPHQPRVLLLIPPRGCCIGGCRPPHMKQLHGYHASRHLRSALSCRL